MWISNSVHINLDLWSNSSDYFMSNNVNLQDLNLYTALINIYSVVNKCSSTTQGLTINCCREYKWEVKQNYYTTDSAKDLVSCFSSISSIERIWYFEHWVYNTVSKSIESEHNYYKYDVPYFENIPWGKSLKEHEKMYICDSNYSIKKD